MPGTWSENLWLCGNVCACGFGTAEDCPTGDDPHTPGVFEIQQVSCMASGGSFTLSFRQFITEPIFFDDTVAELTAKLQVTHCTGACCLLHAVLLQNSPGCL